MVMALMVTACGFQLRGTIDASEIQNLSLEVSDRNFQRTLTRTLEQTGITITEDAPYTVNVISLDREETMTTTSGGGIVTDYDVVGTLNWQLVDKNGLVLIPKGELSQYGTYQRRDGEYNASQSELELVWSEIQRNLAFSLTRRIASLTNTELTTLTEEAIEAQEAAEKTAAQVRPSGLMSQ